MDKKDCKIGMFVAVMQNVNPLARSRTRVKRIGKIVGIYDSYVNLLLFDSNIKEISDFDNIIIRRKLYTETFRFRELTKIEKAIIDER